MARVAYEGRWQESFDFLCRDCSYGVPHVHDDNKVDCSVMPAFRRGALMVIAAALVMSNHSYAEQMAAAFERGEFPARWSPDSPDCAGAAPFRAHQYNSSFIILRQSGCTNFEKPFLYLLFGAKEALLVDTGARGADPSGVVEGLLRDHARRQQQPELPLLVVHSHGHGDHTAGDAALRGRAGTRVVEGTPQAVAQFFAMQNWPRGLAQYDLGDRMLDIVPIPGHEVASIAIYDRRTGILLTGDTLYPGRLYVRDGEAFRQSIDRLVDFTASRGVAHVLGAHIENTRTPYVDYPEGTVFQPDEHALELARAHLLELQLALRDMAPQLERRRFRDFTVWPVAPGQ